MKMLLTAAVGRAGLGHHDRQQWRQICVVWAPNLAASLKAPAQFDSGNEVLWLVT